MKTIGLVSLTNADMRTAAGLGLKMIHTEEVVDAIKVGMYDSLSSCRINFLRKYTGPVVFEGADFSSAAEILHHTTVWVLDMNEVVIKLNRPINSQEAIENAASELLSLGSKSILIKGARLYGASWIHDYWTNGPHSFWLSRYAPNKIYPESGAIFSTALTSFLALEYSVEDALVIATMYVSQAIRLGQKTPYYGGFPEQEADIPYLSARPLNSVPNPFKRTPDLGLYPVVDSVNWVRFLLKQGVKTIQLRIKERSPALELEMKESIALAKQHQAILFINDYWDLALKLDAQALHLGQADLDTADLESIQRQGLLLGVSTYCYYEVARAHAVSPSYIAIGPIYATTSKDVTFPAQGIKQLERWRRTLNYPLVAIGGINLERLPDVAATGVSGVALISAITQAADPGKATQELLKLI